MQKTINPSLIQILKNKGMKIRNQDKAFLDSFIVEFLNFNNNQDVFEFPFPKTLISLGHVDTLHFAICATTQEDANKDSILKALYQQGYNPNEFLASKKNTFKDIYKNIDALFDALLQNNNDNQQTLRFPFALNIDSVGSQLSGDNFAKGLAMMKSSLIYPHYKKYYENELLRKNMTKTNLNQKVKSL